MFAIDGSLSQNRRTAILVSAPNRRLIASDFVHIATAQSRNIFTRRRNPLGVTVRSSQKPFCLFVVALQSLQRPFAFQLFATEEDRNCAFPIIALDNFIGTDVPNHDCPSAVLT